MNPTNEELRKHWRLHGLVVPSQILSAFAAVPREQFLPKHIQEKAYVDQPLPIGFDQTISQPQTVIKMLELLEVESHHTILEIGAGSGYNAALLGKLGRHVYAIEYLEKLADQARAIIQELQIENVTIMQGDGKIGFAQYAPFDRIIVTAASLEIPKPLINQLALNGVLVAPVGEPYQCDMTKLRKLENEIQTTHHGLYAFVPLL